ncbi:transcriptional regulator [Rhodobacteraceae bacterium CCMM004]|nr:transcriptional regulator [Rhodobacteraceae bacterium CCMM004]
MAEVRRSLWIDAPPEVVHRQFTDPARIAAWAGCGADLDPRPGGIYRLDMGRAGVFAGRFVTVTPGLIVQEVGVPGQAPSRIEIVLAAEAGGTRLTLTHSGLPDGVGAMAGRGWDHHLARLAVAAAGGAPAGDSLCVRPLTPDGGRL